MKIKNKAREGGNLDKNNTSEKNIKRKHPSESDEPISESLKNVSLSDDEDNTEEEYDFTGLIVNDDDSSDEDGQGAESDSESGDELSFEEESGNENSDGENPSTTLNNQSSCDVFCKQTSSTSKETKNQSMTKSVLNMIIRNQTLRESATKDNILSTERNHESDSGPSSKSAFDESNELDTGIMTTTVLRLLSEKETERRKSIEKGKKISERKTGQEEKIEEHTGKDEKNIKEELIKESVKGKKTDVEKAAEKLPEKNVKKGKKDVIKTTVKDKSIERKKMVSYNKQYEKLSDTTFLANTKVQKNKNKTNSDEVGKFVKPNCTILPDETKDNSVKMVQVTQSKGDSEKTVHDSPPVDEYDSDTSDEEDIRNTVGNIPMNWYDEYEHIGYDWEGKPIAKPPQGDELDNFLRKMEDPNFWRTVKDPQTGQDVILCDADVELIQRLQKSKFPDPQFDAYAPWIEWFTSDVMKTPLRHFPEHKRSFTPSKDEARKVSRIVYAIKMGWIKPRPEKKKEQQFYMLWETDDEAERMRRIHDHIPAPKRHLPNHAESYNPPPEYLFDKIERKQFKSLPASKKKLHFVPEKYSSLREVPFYEEYVQERFRRCLDLYLCPRARKMKLLIQPEDLVPKLPNPKDLQPFPTTQSLVYKGHTDMVRTITVEPKGQYIASGSDDLTVKIWEVATARCIRTIPAGGIVRSISWCPNSALSLLAVAADRKLLVINPAVGDSMIVKKTDTLLEEAPEHDVLVSERVNSAVQWEQATGEEWRKGIRIIINHFKEIKQVTWHGRGDYFASVMADAQNRSVLIHQVSKRRSQIPFNKAKGLIQCVLFHPIRPIFFVATQKNIRVYDLMKQEILKKLMSNSKWVSKMAVHPAGDNLLVGTYDRKILWFDLDLSTKPYQTLRFHSGAVRGVAFHKRYPLFASSSDDENVIVSHGMVYNDLLQNPLIVPLKKLSFHEKVNDFSMFEVVFHPSQPWLFSSGADGTVRLFS